MKEVLVDVKSRADLAELKFKQILTQNITLVLSKYKK
jgi:hypothetical protein